MAARCVLVSNSRNRGVLTSIADSSQIAVPSFCGGPFASLLRQEVEFQGRGEVQSGESLHELKPQNAGIYCEEMLTVLRLGRGVDQKIGGELGGQWGVGVMSHGLAVFNCNGLR